MKFHSSMALFGQAEQENQIFNSALQEYFNGDADAATLVFISAMHGN